MDLVAEAGIPDKAQGVPDLPGMSVFYVIHNVLVSLSFWTLSLSPACSYMVHQTFSVPLISTGTVTEDYCGSLHFAAIPVAFSPTGRPTGP